MTDSGAARVLDTGITCLHSGGGNPKADLVFVHGLGGHPQLTWSTEPHEPKASAEPGVPTPKRVLNQFFSLGQRRIGPAWSRKRKRSTDDILASEPQGAREGMVFWPRDLLPQDVEDVRVLTFGYYSNPGGASQDNLYTLSRNLLRDVANERINAPDRPIIFVVHSLGGILAKCALKMSQDSTGADARLKAVRNSTRGVIFFSTPHSGSLLASWGEMLRRIAGIFSVTNSTLLAALDSKSDNGQLTEISLNFDKMLGPGSEGKFQVFNFQEVEPVLNGPLGPMSDLVVPLNSSMIVSQWAAHATVPANHINICKFGGPTDVKYKAFMAELQQGFLNGIDARDQLQPQLGGRDGLSAEKRGWLQALYTCPYRERKDLNPQRVQGTCEWFTNHQLFQNWEKRSVGTSLLWITADPGCGKSVLARYLVDDKLQANETRAICYFFFEDRFEDQGSSESALCCLLRQLLLQNPTDFSDWILRKLEEDGGTKDGNKVPPRNSHDLWSLFLSAAVHYQGSEVVCVLDALDECAAPGRDYLIGRIVELYRNRPAATPAIKFLLTSRPYSGAFKKLWDLGREVPSTHLNGEDDEVGRKITSEIDMVIRRRVETIHGLGSKEQEVLLEELTKVNNRTYLWVHLIFDEIERNGILLSQGRVRLFVRNSPQTVDEAYDRILSKSKDTRLARRIIHIVLAAARPLTLREMAVALAIRPAHGSWNDLESELFPMEHFRRDIRAACGLFVIISATGRIHLFHQTAREFLVASLSYKPSELQPWKGSFRSAESNRILAEICLWRLSLSDFDLKGFYTSGGRRRYIEERPFLMYAVRFWVHHIRESDCKASDAVIERACSLFDRQLPASMVWMDLFRVLTGLRADFVPLVAASGLGLAPVVQRLVEADADVNEEDIEGLTPLHHASITGNNTVIMLLLKANANVDKKCLYTGETPLHIASGGGFDVSVQKLLVAGADPNAQADAMDTPLHHATWCGFVAIVRLLLDNGADPGAKDCEGWSPLLLASDAGDDTVVELLLKRGAKVDEKEDIHGGAPLHWASSNGHHRVVQQLLAEGASHDAEDADGSTPLHWACAEGYYSIVKDLISAGSDVNKESGVDGGTPLCIASELGYLAVVQLLVDAGANVNKKDRAGETPLLSASRGGYADIVRLLLKAGANTDRLERG